MHIFCDFDGTITQQDATDYVLELLADEEWLSIEQQWKAGIIGSADCMRRQIELIRADKTLLDSTLEKIEIDQKFAAFSQFCTQKQIPVTIVSDGVDYFIKRILARHGITEWPVISNRLLFTDDGYTLAAPYDPASCQSGAGVCKCDILRQREPAYQIYIGDGRSDFCVANKPDLIFAKSALADYCRTHNIPFQPYVDFAGITDALAARFEKPRQMAAGA